METNTDSIQLLEQLVRLLRPEIPLEVDIWDAKTVAAFLKVAPRYVTERYALMDDFPTPFRLPSKNGRGHPRWKAVEIIRWAEQYRSPHA